MSINQNNINYNLKDESSVDEVSIDEIIDITSPTEDPRLKIIELYNKIQVLKDTSSELLNGLKQCRKSFQDATWVVEKINDKTTKR